jgi:ketol-acid reductoisomerase
VNDRLTNALVAVVGFGNQGEAQALNLRAAGVEVVVGARAGGGAEARARSQGFPTVSLREAIERSAIATLLLPDEVLPTLWSDLVPALRGDARVVFAHGFALLYGDLAFPSGADVVLVSPTAPGSELRKVSERGRPLPAYLAVHRDGSGDAWGLAEDYAARLGCAPTWQTTVREETEVDLFGEQAVLCGGMNALVLAAFETLVAKGYSPEIAYLECVHQLKYLADLLHERGPAGFRAAISGTARYGDVTRGPRIVGASSRAEMEVALEEIRSGAFAREWLSEFASGGQKLTASTESLARHPIEAARVRALDQGAGMEGVQKKPATLCPKTD